MLDFSRLEQYRENNRIEAKKAVGGLPRSIWETYSSFANTMGGIILLGVEELADKRLHAVPLPDPEKLVREFWQNVNDQDTASVNILSEDRVRIEDADGCRIVVIEVPAASRFDRPVYVGGDSVRGIYRRDGEGDYRCSEAEISAMRRDAEQISADRRILQNLPEESVQKESVRIYRQMLRSVCPGHRTETMGDTAFLTELGLLVPEEEGCLHPAAAGVLFFGRRETILQQFPGFRLSCSENGAEKVTDQVLEFGNLLDYYLFAASRLKALIQRRGGFADPVLAESAMRGGLVNCICNADYYAGGPIAITGDADAVIMTNPGTFRSADQSGRISDPRNTLIMKLFQMIGEGQGTGGGIPRMLYAWKQLGMPEPVFIHGTHPERVSLVFPLQRNMRCGAEKQRTGTEQLVIRYLTDHGRAGSRELAGFLNLSIRQTGSLLKKLIDEGIVTPLGRGRGRVYTLKY